MNVIGYCCTEPLKLTPLLPHFSGISDAVLNDLYDMMSYDPGLMGWASDDTTRCHVGNFLCKCFLLF